MTVKESLQAALKALGPNGENWAKVDEKLELSPKKLGALTTVGRVTECNASTSGLYLFREANVALNIGCPAGYETVMEFNDAPETVFEDIKNLFVRAIAIADDLDSIVMAKAGL